METAWQSWAASNRTSRSIDGVAHRCGASSEELRSPAQRRPRISTIESPHRKTRSTPRTIRHRRKETRFVPGIDAALGSHSRRTHRLRSTLASHEKPLVHQHNESRGSPTHRPGLRAVRHTTAEHYTRIFRDRKSTRLNSSHQIISYAVFCLKKKNKQ